MIVFGGYQKNDANPTCSNDVWCLNLLTLVWTKPKLSALKPPARYGQFQIAIDNFTLLILGGCGGPNNMFNDAWVLNFSEDTWKWKTVNINNKMWSASHMWCNPVCKVSI